MHQCYEIINKLKCRHYGLIERTYLYDGLSVFSPALNQRRKITIFDYKFKNFQPKRMGKQANWLKKSNFKFVNREFRNLAQLQNQVLRVQ